PMESAPLTRTHATSDPMYSTDNRRSREHPFDKKIRQLHASGMPKHVATRIARQRHPGLFADYQEANAYGGSGVPLEKRAVRIAKAAAQEWSWLVEEVSRRNCISKCAAASRLRAERPDLFLALQSSVPTDDDAA